MSAADLLRPSLDTTAAVATNTVKTAWSDQRRMQHCCRLHRIAVTEVYTARARSLTRSKFATLSPSLAEPLEPDAVQQFGFLPCSHDFTHSNCNTLQTVTICTQPSHSVRAQALPQRHRRHSSQVPYHRVQQLRNIDNKI